MLAFGFAARPRPGTFRSRFVVVLLTFAVLSWLAPLPAFAGPTLNLGRTAEEEPKDKASDTKDKSKDSKDEPETAPDSPRAAWREFKEATNDGRFRDAARFLDLPRAMSEDDAAHLAESLDTVLRYRLEIDEEDLSPLSMGDANDGLPPGVDGLGVISRRDTSGADPVRMIRRTESDGSARWVFARTTVERVPKWNEETGDRWFRDHAPRVLLRRGPLGVARWELLLVPLTVLVCLALAFGLERVFRPLVARSLHRLVGLTAEEVGARHKGPARLLWTLALFTAIKPFTVFDRNLSGLLGRAAGAAFVVAIAWVFTTVLDMTVLATQRLSLHVTPGFRGAFALLGKIGKVALWILSIIATLSILGYPVGSILAGLGIGGLALALAAQKTVENLFGCVSIGIDQPFRVGDFVNVEGVKGTVEYLGLRSTRIRTQERTIVTIPNGKLAEMRIENFAIRDRYRLQTVLPLAMDSSFEKVRSFMAEALRILEETEGVVRQDIEVNLNVAKESIDVELVATIRAASFPAFRERKHGVIFTVMDRLANFELALARPVPRA